MEEQVFVRFEFKKGSRVSYIATDAWTILHKSDQQHQWDP